MEGVQASARPEGPRCEARRVESGVGFLERGSQPLPPAKSLGSTLALVGSKRRAGKVDLVVYSESSLYLGLLIHC